MVGHNKTLTVTHTALPNTVGYTTVLSIQLRSNTKAGITDPNADIWCLPKHPRKFFRVERWYVVDQLFYFPRFSFVGP